MESEGMKKQANRERFIELRAGGQSYQSIADTLGITKQTAIGWSKDFNCEIKNLKAMHLDCLYEQHLMTREARIKVLGEQLEKVRAEIIQRDLGSVSTEKLYDVLLKLMDAQSKERERLAFIQEKDFFSDTSDLPSTLEEWAV
jgi:hypothetical protein